jgi:tRNA threonylcarbamoyladenosine biosynthesis protein TsaB
VSTNAPDFPVSRRHAMSDQRHILALDTATKIQAVALLRDQTPLEDVRHRVAFDHGSSLLTNVSESLDEHDLVPADLDLLAVGIGPGSFTGLRISLALAKGIAISRDVPLVAVSSLAALALPHTRSFPGATVIPAYDARRDEVFCGEFSWVTGGDDGDAGLTRTGPDRTVAAESLRAELDDRLESHENDGHTDATGPEVVLVGNGPHTYDVLSEWEDPRVRVVPDWMGRVTAVSVAMLGSRQFRSDGGDDIATLEPNYIRPSSAEEAKQAGDLPDIPT